MAEHIPPPSNAAAGHELSDLDPKKIGWFGAALALLIIGALLASYLLFNWFYASVRRAQPKPSPLSFNREPTPEPRLSVRAGDELQSLRAEEEKALNSYEWVDRDHGIVRIPIARAMEIVVERGLPVRGESNDGAAGTKVTARRKETAKR